MTDSTIKYIGWAIIQHSLVLALSWFWPNLVWVNISIATVLIIIFLLAEKFWYYNNLFKLSVGLIIVNAAIWLPLYELGVLIFKAITAISLFTAFHIPNKKLMKITFIGSLIIYSTLAILQYLFGHDAFFFMIIAVIGHGIIGRKLIRGGLDLRVLFNHPDWG